MRARTVAMLVLAACAASRPPPSTREAGGSKRGLLWVTIVAKGME